MLLIAFVVLSYVLYLPIGAWSAGLGGRPLDVALDRATPFVPELVFVYGLLYPAAALPLVVPLERRVFRRVAAAYLSIEALSFAVFVLFPVHMTLRPELPADGGFATWTMALLFWADHPSNCFPSLHVSTAVLAALCVGKVDRVLGGVGLVLAAAISASTMFVKQHYLADVLAGAALALVAWWFLVRPVPVERVPFEWRRLRPLVLAQVLLYAVLFLLHRGGVRFG